MSGYAQTLSAFCDRCIRRGYLETNPLDGLAPFDTAPEVRRRAMTPDEVTRLLAVSPPDRRLLYETALFSGLRVNELRHLTLEHLNLERNGLHLDAAWTKNREEGFQPLPRELLGRLKAFVDSGEPARLYEEKLRQGGSSREVPVGTLLYVPGRPTRSLSKDLKAAGIPEKAPGGKLDFHALRTAFVNLVFEFAQVSPKEAQDLARHSTPNLTFNVYGRSRENRLVEGIERLAEAVMPIEKSTRRVPAGRRCRTRKRNSFFNNRLRFF